MIEKKQIEMLRARLSLGNAPYVLATVVATNGISYRKAGAQKLIEADGTSHGLLSGGCFDQAIVENAMEVLQNQNHRRVCFDLTEDDAIFGFGLGCPGVVDIFLEYCEPDQFLSVAPDRKPYYEIVLVESSRTDWVGARYILCDGELQASRLVPRSDELGLIVKKFGQPISSELIKNDSHSFFFRRVDPPPRLTIFGNLEDARCVSLLADKMGWERRIASARIEPNWLNDEQFCSIDGTDLNLCLDEADACLLMAHNFDEDCRSLAGILSTPAFYIGLLGPRSRAKQMFAKIPVRESDAKRIFAPIGLRIGGREPMEIALSAISQIQQEWYRRFPT